MTIHRKIVIKFLQENPDLPNRTAARTIHKQYPEVFSSIESVRSIIKKLKKMDDSEIPIIGKSILYDSNGEVKLQWVKEDHKSRSLELFKEAINGLKEEVPSCELTYPTLDKDINYNLCNQYTLTDYHFGMMAWGEESGSDWDLEIAEETIISFFKKAIELSPQAGECILAQIGDLMHWDGLEAVTPANRHLLDADTRFTKLVRTVIRCLRQIISMLLAKYPKVHLVMAEGNHDPASSVWLREVFSSFYDIEPRITVETSPDIYYQYTFGDCCLFYHHGHKRNIKNIDSVFVRKFKNEFGSSKFVYAHTGHLHHEKIVESNLMTIEQHPTLAAKDSYASRGGYMSNRNAKVITYHKKHGEVYRSTLDISLLK